MKEEKGSGPGRGKGPKKSTNSRSSRSTGGFDRKSDRSERPTRSAGGFDRKSDRSERPTRNTGGFDRKSDRSERPTRNTGGFDRKSDRSERPTRNTGGFDRKSDRSERPTRSTGGFDRKSDRSERPTRSTGGFDRKSDRGERPTRNTSGFDRKSDRGERPTRNTGGFDRKSDRGERPLRSSDQGERRDFNSDRTRRPSGDFDRNKERPTRGRRDEGSTENGAGRRPRKSTDFGDKSGVARRSEKPEFLRKNKPDEEIRLNRYISNSGVCSRRKADELIAAGEVTVNGEVIKELGYKVKYSDKIKYNGKQLKPGKLVYVLLNKPKDYITTMEDPQERRTVVELIRNASEERIFPVGRLDRNTTGLLLLTNDGDLADKLAHPRNGVEKIYEVELDKSLTASDFEVIKAGVELEDGFARVDDIAYVEGKSKKNVGIKIHIGRNRIVRRIFEHLGYEVVKLDRVVYAGLTKKDLPRGRHRHLTKEEIILLKHFK